MEALARAHRLILAAGAGAGPRARSRGGLPGPRRLGDLRGVRRADHPELGAARVHGVQGPRLPRVVAVRAGADLLRPPRHRVRPAPGPRGRARRLRAPRVAGPRPAPASPPMVWWLSATVLFGVLTALLAVGLPVAFAFLAINIVGAWLWLGQDAGLVQMVRNGVASITSFSVTPLPFFLLMGGVLFQDGVAIKANDAIDRLVGRGPGR